MTAIGLIVAVIAKIIVLTGNSTEIYAISVVFSNEIWFVFGMCICSFNMPLGDKKLYGIIIGVLFLGVSVVSYFENIKSPVVSFVLGVVACASVILLMVSYQERSGRVMSFLAKHTMPIFLMHTIFAASLRAVLLKIGITNAAIHILLGLGMSFVGPIVAEWIMEKTRWMEFFLYPNKTLKNIKRIGVV